MVSHVAESLVKSGKVSRGYLGVTLQGITANLKESLELKSNQGALVSDVVAGSPAAKAGLKEGDVILALNGKPVTDANNLRIQVSSFAPGTKLGLEVLRNGDTKTLSATTGERPGQNRNRKSDAPTPALDDEGVLNGVAVDDLTPKHREQFNIPARIKGAVITNVDPASPSAKAGLRAGDVILEINKRPVTNAEDAVELSTKADTKKTLVRLHSRGNTVFVVVDETESTAGQ
jgi:serine protease Do